MNLGGVILWSLLLLLPRASATPLSTAGEVGPTYVLLIGHDRAPRLPRLHKVHSDLVQMHRFFSVLQPARVVVHTDERSLAMQPGGEAMPAVRPATLAELRRTVDELVATLDAAPPGARVYVFYAGHGKRLLAGDTYTTELYLQPGADGHDGRLSAMQLSDYVLAPLAERADVHLILDACQSYFVLAQRGGPRLIESVPKRPESGLHRMERRFGERFPTIGVLAAGGHFNAYEDPALGGLFSFALRSSAIGHADTNRDGIITYGELDRMIRWVMSTRLGSIRPGVLGPGGNPDETFIDYRTTRARRVVFPAGRWRHEVFDENLMPHVIVYPRTTDAEPIYLPPEGRYHVVATIPGSSMRQAFTIESTSDDLRPAHDVSPLVRGPVMLFGKPPPVDFRPFDKLWAADEPELPPYVGGSLTVGAHGLFLERAGTPTLGPVLEVAGAWGRGRLQGLARLRYGWWQASEGAARYAGSPAGRFSYTAHQLDVGLGIDGYAAVEPTWEWAVGAELLTGPTLQHDDLVDEWILSASIVPAIRTRVAFTSPWSSLPIVVDAYVGARLQPVERDAWRWPLTIGLLVGSRLEGAIDP